MQRLCVAPPTCVTTSSAPDSGAAISGECTTVATVIAIGARHITKSPPQQPRFRWSYSFLKCFPRVLRVFPSSGIHLIAASSLISPQRSLYKSEERSNLAAWWHRAAVQSLPGRLPLALSEADWQTDNFYSSESRFATSFRASCMPAADSFRLMFR